MATDKVEELEAAAFRASEDIRTAEMKLVQANAKVDECGRQNAAALTFKGQAYDASFALREAQQKLDQLRKQIAAARAETTPREGQP